MPRAYVIAVWVHSADGYRPALPAGIGGYNVLGGFPDTGVALWSVSDPVATREGVTQVPRSLVTLLDAARGYPPAMASAVRHMDRQGPSTPDEFAAEMEQVLRQRLEQQRDRRHCLIESAVTEVGHRDTGEFVWVVGYRPANVGREVSWMAGDFQSYDDNVQSFVVDPDWLAGRFA